MIRREIKILSLRDKDMLYRFAFENESVDTIADHFGTTKDEVLQTLTDIAENIRAEAKEYEGEE